MGELEERLRRAAGRPTRVLDLDAIATRAARRRQRRWAGGASAIAFAVALGLFAPAALPDPGPAPDIVSDPERGPAPHRTPSPTGGPVPGERSEAWPDGSATPLPPGEGPTDPATSDPDRSAGTTAAPDPSPQPTPTGARTREPSPTETTPPAGTGCRTEWGSCSFVATAPGGYRSDGSGDWTVTVVRDGRTTIYTGLDSADCGEHGTIQPGDHVTVDASAGSSEEIDAGVFARNFTYVAAGADWSCDRAGPS